MARREARPPAQREVRLTPRSQECVSCGKRLWVAYHAQRTLTDLLERYEELVALHLADEERVKARLKQQGQVLLAIDGMQPDVGQEVLWLIRDCLSGEVLLARTLLSSTRGDLAALLSEVKEQLEHLEVP